MLAKPYFQREKVFIFLAVILSFFSCSPGSDLLIVNMKVEGQSGWVVTNETSPRLTWELNTNEIGKNILAYEFLAASTKTLAEEGRGDLKPVEILPVEKGAWVLFDASGLSSQQEVFWRIRLVFEDETRSEWSDVAHFETGIKDEDWKGKWIGMNPESRKRSAPQFRTSFAIEKELTKARLYVCGLGYHESYLNGEKLGEEVLQPAQTDYNLRTFYVAHDVKEHLVKGPNVLGFWVGDGFYNQDLVWGPKGLSYGEPKVLAQLELTYQDGTKDIIVSNEEWKCRKSPINSSNIYAGENFDAQLYDENWADNSGPADAWEPVVEAIAPGGKLIAQQLPPCRKMETIPAVSVDSIKPGTWVFDFGQNLVGWAKLKVKASPGTKITIRFAENRLPDGALGFASSGVRATKVIQTDTYTCKGGELEIWEPRFSYHGFRFAEVTVSEGALRDVKPTKEMLEGIVIYTDMAVVGEFECSDPTLNKAYQLAHWTQIGGVLGVPADCPVRERCGWTGDAHNIVPYTLLHLDAAAMWRKYIDDIVTTAQVTGPMLCFGDEFGERTREIKKVGIPTMVAPGKRFIGEGSPDWGCAIAFIPWDIYVRTGDMRSLEQHYESIRLWASHLEGLSKNGIVYSGMGDWCKPAYKTTLEGRALFGRVTPMLSTACYYRSVRITADAAKLLGKSEDYQYFNALANHIREAFTKAFYSENPEYIPDQTINAIAINWGVLAPELHEKVARVLARQVKEADYHFTTGVFGMPSLWPVLGRFGYQQTAWKALQQESAPSFKYLLKRGATTWWEVWPMEGDAHQEYIQSMSHPFQGGFVAWFFEGLAGIQPDVNRPGYRLIHLEPQLMDGLDWVKCRFKSSMGEIESSWNKQDSKLVWNIEIPPGAEAQLRVPGRIIHIKSDSNDSEMGEVPREGREDVAQQLRLPSGKYQITSVL